ncbi:TonB family protein [Sphingopyxis sp. NJF-3]
MLSLSLLLALAADPSRPPAPPPATMRAGPPSPATSPGSWVTPDDYPARARRDEREGVVGFRLTVDADGLPSGCDVTASSGHADLDEKTCQLLMERARFTPARDENGQKVASSYTNRIRWQLPDVYAAALANAGFQFDESRESWPRSPIATTETAAIDAAAHYPPAARAARVEGAVQMLLGIDAAGLLAGCKVVESSMSAALDAAACDLMRTEGRFLPALDSDGKPVRGTLPAIFRWVLPRGADASSGAVPERPLSKFPMSEPGFSTMSILVGADGKVADCKYSAGGVAERMTNPCDEVGGSIRYIPFVDADGQPVAKRITGRMDLIVEDAEAAKKGEAK